jgi:hypothetical protein
MANTASLNWPRYFRTLSADEIFVLAVWLDRNGLKVGEFMEVVDRAHAVAPERWSGQPRRSLAELVRASAGTYADRKRRFAALMTAFEDALSSGAFPGDVAPQELRPSPPGEAGHRQTAALVGALERAARGEE